MLNRIKRFVARSINYTMTFSDNGNTIRVPVINDTGRANRDRHEDHMRVVLRRCHTPETLLIDVGVNIGQTLIKYALIVGPDCRYLGFEPNAKAAAYVDEIITRNVLSRASVVPVGLGAGKQLTQLLMAAPGSTDPGASTNPMMRDSSFYSSRKTVAITDGDSALADLGIDAGPVIIKIDVEGGETAVVEGLGRVLRELRPFVIMEILPPDNFSPTVNEYRRHRAEQLKDLMTSYRFTRFGIGDEGELNGGDPTCDHLFVPDERVDDFLGSP